MISRLGCYVLWSAADLHPHIEATFLPRFSLIAGVERLPWLCSLHQVIIGRLRLM